MFMHVLIFSLVLT